jgi:hypothetical protein
MFSLLHFKHILETTTFHYTFQCVFVKFTTGFLRSFIAHFRTLQNTINMAIILDTVNNIWCKAFTVTVYNGTFSRHWPYQCEVYLHQLHTEEEIYVLPKYFGRWSCLVIRYIEGKVPIQLRPSEQANLCHWTTGRFPGGPSGNHSFLTCNGNRSSFWNCLKDIQDDGQHLKWVKFILTCRHQSYLDPRI